MFSLRGHLTGILTGRRPFSFGERGLCCAGDQDRAGQQQRQPTRAIPSGLDCAECQISAGLLFGSSKFLSQASFFLWLSSSACPFALSRNSRGTSEEEKKTRGEALHHCGWEVRNRAKKTLRPRYSSSGTQSAGFGRLRMAHFPMFLFLLLDCNSASLRLASLDCTVGSAAPSPPPDLPGRVSHSSDSSGVLP